MEKSTSLWNLSGQIEYLCRNKDSDRNEWSKYKNKQNWTSQDGKDILNKLKKLFLSNKLTKFGILFRPILLDIVWRCRLQVEQTDLEFKQHQSLCIALSNCLHWPDIQRFTLDYINGKPGFILCESADSAEPKRKKVKKSQTYDVNVLKAAWLFSRYLGDGCSHLIPLKDVLSYTHHDNLDVRWFACQTIMEQQKLSPTSREKLLKRYFTVSQIEELKIRHELMKHTDCMDEDLKQAMVSSNPNHVISEVDLCDRVVCIGGVIISKVNRKTDTEDDCSLNLDLLPVPSNESNLHSLAMAVSSGSAVLLQGVVGSGKTSLVEHLARLTGRPGPPALMKIQMGDQMDSKALLGTYRCTEVPGEFVWQPGVLTQAVTQGYWVLLEDIDYAPMEVISVLLPLLETRTLSVPGHGDTIRAAPGFQLFATQRLLSSSSGWSKQQSSNCVLLDKLWTSILVEPLSRTELSEVLCTKYPGLETVVDKLLDIYFLLSAGGHQIESSVAMDTDAENVGKFLSRDGRQISTRDLITWCGRISRDFDVSSTAAANMVFLEALDCFVACMPKRDRRTPLAEAIAAKLNITKVKVEYFMNMYKPDVTVSMKTFGVGRVTLPMIESCTFMQARKCSMFSYTRQSSVLLERVSVCVRNQEPVLLVGETGTGKTSAVQYLAEQLGHKLHVINMNQQSDSADLLGGFKPVDVQHIIKPFYEDFELQFCKSFSRKQNAKFIGHLMECFSKRKWDALFGLIEHTTKSALKKFENEVKTLKKWQTTYRRLAQLKLQVQQTQNALAFTFMEGTLVKAIRAGEWVLLDEINLAATETLECLSGLLERTSGSLLLMERGDVEPVVRHPDFRLFACMNPATDVGKKDLSLGIRNRFTELFVDELEDQGDLKILVCDYLQGLSLTAGQVDGIVKFYLTIRNEASKKLTDGTGHPPHYSLRTLCRALRYAAKNSCSSVPRSLYEGFCLSFLTQLDRSSHPVVQQLVCQHVLTKSNQKSVLKQALPIPPGGKSLNFEGYWISVGDQEPYTPDDYILTPSVRANLKDLVRVVSAGQHPVLLQGETSVGKTSLIRWLSQSTGNVCVRVNNHEHTDLQEYVGCYAADENGKLAFKEGVLVEAMRKGHWIILDELNLAPTDVLEALNRLLDDNRELYIPETQETVKAHTKFMLFATQNPPGQYGGRKMLSRAFRNRFVELHFDEIPSKELETILHERCDIPLSYARRLVAVMLELQTRRRGSGVFAGKMGFMTLRDLFRWAGRYKCPEMDKKKFYDWDKHLADQGYMLLAGRVRKSEEVNIIQEVIQKHFKCKVNPGSLFTMDTSTSLTSKSSLERVLGQSVDGFHHVVWTYSMRRLAVLIGQAIRYKEPILLVGETGCGKTTVCQLYAALYNTMLRTINCHLHTESTDFLGGLRPVRSHTEEESKDKLFEWVDGPLVQSMKEGAMFLIDEISLADDSVLERLNSVLELERTILLAEKGGGDGNQNEVEQVVAKDGFHVFATMNPGGDFGKKELSPALRNRFTEIWCPPSNQRQDLIDIIEHNLHAGIHLCNQEDGTSGIGRAIMDFVEWFGNNELGKRCTVSIRDILTWVQFINTCSKTVDTDIAMDTDDSPSNQLDPAVAYIHGACLVFLDGLGAGTTSQGKDNVVASLRKNCLTFLVKQVNTLTHQMYDLTDLCLHDYQFVAKVSDTKEEFFIPPFSIPKGNKECSRHHQYALNAPGTSLNAQRVLRALQLSRPLLLEGSPGVGKTSLVAAIARAADRDLVRINLSEQTDVTDLFGADLPVEGSEGGVFAWRDGPLLQALKAGSWVVLDELNLASQSLLEGLNACLDHRAEVYIPELGKTFHIKHEKTRLFACQNPLNQGGGRKGLPRSFLNRFTQVYVEPLSSEDLMYIATSMYPRLPSDVLSNMVLFNMKIHENTVVQNLWGQKGSPWEFNLRDLFRWCDLLIHSQVTGQYDPGEYVGLVYADRMRTIQDKQQVYDLFSRLFGSCEAYRSTGVFHYDGSLVQIGHSFLKVTGEGDHRGNNKCNIEMLHQSMPALESLMKCVEMNWMTILVGASYSGKSCLVEMLSQLSGNQLNVLAMNSAMDTTELLGGFEQADHNRHSEEFAGEVRNVVHSISSQCLLIGDQGCLDMVAKLLELWEDYKKQQVSGDTRSNMEEIDILKSQLETLLQITVMCKKIIKKYKTCEDYVDQLVNLKKKISKMKQKLSSTQAGQGGGAFEWIDSLLVRSLREGHWLLIDNVNFCSASVLDRLNAMLEPNGVLAINERGVLDGEIPTVTPHPNFRLFLSMDPKHGEISRAMRNRGIEIFIPGEADGCYFSDFDLRQIVTGMGLKSKPVFDWLQKLQHLLIEELPRGDKPGLQNLLQACQLTVEHCNHGNDIKTSLKSACYSVYVQRQRHTQSKQKSVDILNTQLEVLDSVVSGENVPLELGIYPVRLPSIHEITKDSVCAMLRRNSAVFTHLIQAAKSGTEDQSDSKLKSSLNLLLQLCTKNNIHMTIDWLQNFCKNENQSGDICEYSVSSLHDISSTMMVAMETMGINESLNPLTSGQSSDCSIDLRWNLQMLERFVHNYSSDDPDILSARLYTSYNRLFVLQRFLVDMSLVRRHMKQLEAAVQRDKGRVQQTTHEAVTHLVALFPLLVTAITDIIPNMEISSFDDTTKILRDLCWIQRLYTTSADTLRSQDAGALLALFWKWFHNRTLSSFTGMREQKQLSAIFVILQSILGKDERKWKMFIKYWRSWGHPAPFSTEGQATKVIQARELCRLMDLSLTTSDILNHAKVRLITGNRRRLLADTIQLLSEENMDPSTEDHADEIFDHLRKLLRQHGLISRDENLVAMETDTHETVTSQSDDSMTLTSQSDATLKQIDLPLKFVQLWPVFEYCGVMESWEMVKYAAQKLSAPNQSGGLTLDQSVEKKLQILVDYMSQFTPQNPADLVQYRNLLTNEKVIYPCIVSHVLHTLRKSTAVSNTPSWLEWSDIPKLDVDATTNSSVKPFVHQAALSYMLCSLLSRADNLVSLTTPSNVKINAPLKSYIEEITKLCYVSRNIWSHVGTLSNTSRQPLSLDKACYHTSLVHSLMSCLPFMDVSLVSDVEAGIQSIAVEGLQDADTVSVFNKLHESCYMMDSDTLTLLQEVGHSCTDLDDLGDLGVAWIRLGQFCMNLTAPQGPVDPVEKIAIKLQLLKNELHDVDSELDVICSHHRLVTGQDILETSSRLVHPHVTYLRNQSTVLQANITELEVQVAYRPSPSQYTQLVTDIRNLMNSVVSMDTVNGLVKKLKKLSQKPSGNMAVLQEVELWEISVDRFITMIDTEYPCYRDVTAPFLSALHQLVHGMAVLYHHVRHNTRLISVVKAKDIQTTRDSLQKLVIQVGKFPTVSRQHPSCYNLAMTLTSDSSLTMLNTVLPTTEQDELDSVQMAADSVLTSSLLHLQNAANVRREMSSDLVMTLMKILETYVSSWQQAEEARKQSEEEEASLYRYKSQVHGDERSEEQQLEDEFNEQFPQYTADYCDIVAPESLEDSTVVPSQDDTNEPEMTSLKVSSVQMTQICQIHQQLYKHLVHTDWYQPNVVKPLQIHDWVKPIQSSYTACSLLCKNWTEVLSSSVDSEILGGHLVVSAAQQFYIQHASQQNMSGGLIEGIDVYDIYHDTNVPEVTQCLSVMKGLRRRVNELQEEWPDHPTLKQICDVCDRIESFPITCPVMKFLTGLELLLQTAQDWESNAAQHVSMATQLAEISRQIVEWRKLELDCWKNSLTTEMCKYRSAASKWWFHLYQVLMSFLKQQTEETCSLQDVIKSLKQFIEHSTLGDFHTRLEMLLGYHCHLVSIAKCMDDTVTMDTDDKQTGYTNRRQDLECVLWNMYKFYCRFSDSVTSELERLRAPIEKELKGFVKIARWSDINYWALKQASEKTHRTLHKHLKQFQDILRHPVQGVLGDVDEDRVTPRGDLSSWSDKLTEYQQQMMQDLCTYRVPLNASIVIDTHISSEKYPLQNRLPRLCSRLNQHWIEILSTSRYCQHITSLDEFIGEVIENIHELQALEINRNEEKEKQKSEAKHIDLRKRKALSDLFKYLIQLGLSYRKGLVVTDSYDEALQVPPVDLNVSLQEDDNVQHAWTGSLNYFYKCLSRRAQLLTALVTPSKELGVGNIERCRGFTEHLYTLLIQQHKDVANMAEHYKQISQSLSDIENLRNSRHLAFSQNEAIDWKARCKSLTVSVLEGLNQFVVILKCCPRQQGEVTLHPSPRPADEIHPLALVNHGDEEYNKALTQVEEILSEVMLIQTMLPGKQSNTMTWSDVEVLRSMFTKMAAIIPRMQQLAKLFNDPDSNHSNAFNEVLYFLCDEVRAQSESYITWLDDTEGENKKEAELDTGHLFEYADDVEQIISNILLVIQKQSKHHVATVTEKTSEDMESEDSEELVEGHLVKVIYDNLQYDKQVLELPQICGKVASLVDSVISVKGATQYSALLQVLYCNSPILHQYKTILHHHLISNIATYRTMGKLLSVLLAVFTDLATKGFCIPPELSDEMSGEGATEFCDMENAGMGEGEGVKNVSDQIEDEDQLDEAKRPEDHKKEDEANQPDVKSEENAIEMSDDIDAKVQDLEDVDKENDDDDNDDNDEDEVDKQMGEVDEQDTDKLDEQMWGSDDETENQEEQKEETGAGDGKESEPELVAKDDTTERSEGEKDRENKDEDQEEENEENEKQNNMDFDQDNYDDDQVDPYHGKQEEQQAPDDLDLPDDLNLDDNEEGGKDETEKMEESVDAEKEDESTLPPEDTPDDVPDDADNVEDKKEEKDNQQDEGDDAEGEDGSNENKDITDTADNEEERKDDEGQDDPGFHPQEDQAVDAEEKEEQNEANDITPTVEHYGKTSHDASDDVEQSDTAKDAAGETMENDQQEVDGTGQASADQDEGHQGQKSTSTADSSQGKRKQQDRQPGKSDSDRSLGSDDQKYKRLKTTDSTQYDPSESKNNQEEESKKSDLYEHVKDSKSHYDEQTLDVATAEQQEEQGKITPDKEEADSDVEDDTEIADDKDDIEQLDEVTEMSSSKIKKSSKTERDVEQEVDSEVTMETEGDVQDIPGERITTDVVARGADSTIHTAMEFLHLDNSVFDLEHLRSELENQLGSWTQSNLPSDTDAESAASELWHRYEALTSSLAQDLCEQLRLVLEPSQATKLKGDYRTGKRLNMRKVIPYIASQFRKDKIWLRRTKPSKRQYQIMLAVDDSSSMVDNHSKQMAFESLALISNALTLLESGQLSICSFGETVNILHPFTDQFTSLSGAHLLQYLTFEQKKTKIAQLLKHATSMMMDARNKQHGTVGNPETSQLLVIMSDGRGLFMEGMEVVKTAVRQAREANVFIVFVIIDNPDNKDSILDIKVPVFKPGGKLPEINSYMDSFPFPFYIILRDINSLPVVLSDALRQWFELVTAFDR